MESHCLTPRSRGVLRFRALKQIGVQQPSAEVRCGFPAVSPLAVKP